MDNLTDVLVSFVMAACIVILASAVIVVGIVLYVNLGGWALSALAVFLIVWAAAFTWVRGFW